MLLSLNDGTPESFSHPYNEVEPVLDDGKQNPDYKGTTYVDAVCDSECNCDFQEHIPGICEIEAVLEYPPFSDGYYGYYTGG